MEKCKPYPRRRRRLYPECAGKFATSLTSLFNLWLSRVWLAGSLHQPEPSSQNHGPVMSSPTVIDEFLTTESDLGATCGPFNSNPLSMGLSVYPLQIAHSRTGKSRTAPPANHAQPHRQIAHSRTVKIAHSRTGKSRLVEELNLQTSARPFLFHFRVLKR